LIEWALAQSRGVGHRSLVTPERVLSEYNEVSLSFWVRILTNRLHITSPQPEWENWNNL